MNTRGPKYVPWLIFILAFTVANCSKAPLPTDADVVKAVIARSISENCIVITPTIKFVEKGKRQADGTVVYRVKYTCMGSSKAGQQSDREIVLIMYSVKDSDSKLVWSAK